MYNFTDLHREQLNTTGVAKYSDLGAIERYISETVHLPRLS